MKAILSGKGLKGELLETTTAELAQKAALNEMAKSQTMTVSTTTGLSYAMQGLWNVMKANPLLMVAGGVMAGVTAWNIYQNHLEEVRQKTAQAADTFQETSSSIEDYTSGYQALYQALLAAKGNEEETYQVKKQLLDLQTELNDKYGTEYEHLDLVTNAYKNQTDAIKGLNKEAAKTFLNENRDGIEDAQKQMTDEKGYNLSLTGISSYSEEGKALEEIVKKYEDQGIWLNKQEDGTFNVMLKADAQSAYDTINRFMDDVEEKAKELGDSNVFDSVLELSSSELNRAKTTIDQDELL